MPAPEQHDTGLRPDEVDPERPRPIETPWGTMALYRVTGRILCSQAFCPHLAGPLFQGTLRGSTITCPWHQWRFDLESGLRVDACELGAGPADQGLVRCTVTLSPAGTIVLRLAGRPGPSSSSTSRCEPEETGT